MGRSARAVIQGVAHYLTQWFDVLTTPSSVEARGNANWAQDERGCGYVAHDGVNRLTQELAQDGVATYHQYDDAGRRTAVQVSAANATYYGYDAVGRMTAAGNGEVGWTYYDYDANANVTRQQLGNGACIYFAYDAVNRTSQRFCCAADGSALTYFEYSYDAAGRIERIVREGGLAIYYGYDLPGRLTSERWLGGDGQGIYAFAWDYDAVGNRIHEDRNGSEAYYQYNAAGAPTRRHELDGDRWTYFAYDSRGNCTCIQEQSASTYFEYNRANLVTSIHYPTGGWNYFWYDALLRRCAMPDSLGLAHFTWDMNGLNLLCERDADGALSATHVHGRSNVSGIGTRVGTARPTGGATACEYPFHDGRGSVHRVLDAAGTTTARYEYDAFGVPLLIDESGAPSRFGYQTNWLTLVDSGRHICVSKGRVYWADAGILLQRDPRHGLRGRYGYVKSSPVRRVDPTGLQDEHELTVREFREEALKLTPEDEAELAKTEAEAEARQAEGRQAERPGRDHWDVPASPLKCAALRKALYKNAVGYNEILLDHWMGGTGTPIPATMDNFDSGHLLRKPLLSGLCSVGLSKAGLLKSGTSASFDESQPEPRFSNALNLLITPMIFGYKFWYTCKVDYARSAFCFYTATVTCTFHARDTVDFWPEEWHTFWLPLDLGRVKK